MKTLLYKRYGDKIGVTINIEPDRRSPVQLGEIRGYQVWIDDDCPDFELATYSDMYETSAESLESKLERFYWQGRVINHNADTFESMLALYEDMGYRVTQVD